MKVIGLFCGLSRVCGFNLLVLGWLFEVEVVMGCANSEWRLEWFFLVR